MHNYNSLQKTLQIFQAGQNGSALSVCVTPRHNRTSVPSPAAVSSFSSKGIKAKQKPNSDVSFISTWLRNFLRKRGEEKRNFEGSFLFCSISVAEGSRLGFKTRGSDLPALSPYPHCRTRGRYGVTFLLWTRKEPLHGVSAEGM